MYLFILTACMSAGEQTSIWEDPTEENPEPTAEQAQVNKTILALGDSYTIGTSVKETDRWPVQLAVALRAQGISVDEPLIIARNGWTTEALANGILEISPQGTFDLVMLLIGVNDQFRGYPVADYRQQFDGLLNVAIANAAGDPGRVVVLSIPDWGVTPYAYDKGRDTALISAQIDEFNTANRVAAQEAGAWYVDVTSISRQAAAEPDLLASDLLHPSGKMYALWVEEMLPVVSEILREGS